MKQLLVCIILFVGCSASEAPSAAPPQPSEFQKMISQVVVEAKRAVNLIEMGTSEIERDTQQALLRRIVAGLSPSSDQERSKVETAKNLAVVIETYSSEATSLYLTKKAAKRESRKTDDYSDVRAQLANDLAERTDDSFNETRDRVKQLLTQLD